MPWRLTRLSLAPLYPPRVEAAGLSPRSSLLLRLGRPHSPLHWLPRLHVRIDRSRSPVLPFVRLRRPTLHLARLRPRPPILNLHPTLARRER